MSRFSGRSWMQDKPLALQLFIKLSLGSVLAGAVGLLYMLFYVFPGSTMTAEQWIRCGYLAGNDAHCKCVSCKDYHRPGRRTI